MTTPKSRPLNSGSMMSQDLHLPPKSRPIIFSGAMVRALLAGRKTQTRRLVKSQPPEDCTPEVGIYAPNRVGRDGREYPAPDQFGAWCDGWDVRCPYGQPGDRLWVKETFAETPLVLSIRFDLPPEPRAEPFIYAADHEAMPKNIHRWTSPLFMPQCASRLRREITGVRIEQLQDISEADAKAEGLKRVSDDGGASWRWGIPNRDGFPDDYMTGAGWPWADWEADPRRAYRRLWESIHGEGSWDANPWVWVVEFRRTP